MRRKILFILLGATLLLILHNYIEDRRLELQEEILTLQKKIVKTREQKALKEGKEKSDKRKSLKLFSTPSPTGALSGLQALVMDAAKVSGMEILSVRPSPVIKYTYHEGVVLYVEAKGNARSIEGFLERLHSSERAIFIPKIVINRSSEEGSMDLRLTMEIAGLRSL